MIPPIKRPAQLARLPTVPNHLRKIHRSIKRLSRPAILHDPFVHLHPGALPRRIRVTLSAPAERRDRRTEHLKPGRATVVGDGLVRLDETVADAVLGARVRPAAPDVVDAFEDKHVFHAGLLDCVALVTG